MPADAHLVYIVVADRAVRTAFARLARSARIHAWTFGSVEEFMDADVLDENACVICDVELPGFIGFDLPALLQRAGRHLPVIFVTSTDTTVARVRAKQVGAAAYLPMPVDEEALLGAVFRAVGKEWPSLSLVGPEVVCRIGPQSGS